jgi:GH43 family beta-xylosidase
LILLPLLVTLVHAETWTNPLIPRRADPQIYRDADRAYYFTATVPEYDRIELRQAASIPALATAESKVIWRKHAHGPMSAHIWAPEIHHIDGKWYVYFAAGRAEAIWDIRMYVLENASANPLQGDWTEKGQIQMNWESFTLDATTFEHRGVRYLVWAQGDPKLKNSKGTNIYIAAMENPWTIHGQQVMLSKPDLPWEQVKFWVNEGPAVLKKNGRIFITYSASATDANYCMGMLTAADTADLLNPQSWHKSPQPVFQTSETNGQYGPGHNSFTTSLDGRDDLLVYHARNYKEIKGDPLRDPNRATRVQKITWTADGLPIFGAPIPDGPVR